MKKLYYILLLLMSNLFSVSIYSQCPLDIGQAPILNNNGLVLYYPFNGSTQNLGTGSNTAILSGATYTNGICGQALHFDGFNDYVQISPYINMNGSFTIATWIYMDTLTYEQEIFTTREQCQSTYRRHSQCELAINYNAPPSPLQTKRLLYMVNTHQSCTGYASGDRYEPQNINYNSGNWYFIAVTIQNSQTEGRTIDFFIDCQHQSTSFYLNTATAFLFNSSYIYKTYIGGGPNIGSYHYSFDGKIDEFRLYNRILSDNELLNLFYTCKPLDISINKYLSTCQGDSATIELENTQKNTSYQLFDSTNQQMIGAIQNGGCTNLLFNTGLVNSPTDFYIKSQNLSSGCITILDTIISLNPNAVNYLYHDTLEICKGDSTLIRGHYYTAPNTVYDTLINSNGCDSILITSILAIPLPIVNLGNDTSFCDGDSVYLSIVNNNFTNITWSTGSNNTSIYVDSIGFYWVEVSDSNCTNSDTIYISNQSNSFIVINDTLFCDGQIWHISLPQANTYLWSTGSSSNQISIQDSGLYWVSITDICKNYNEEFRVQLEDCNCMMAVPDVFTPNNDGLNDFFYPVINCIFDEYHLVIYNRWGDLLFESDDQNIKWDGKYKGNEVPDGVYFYLIKYKHLLTSEKEGQRSGSITIFR